MHLFVLHFHKYLALNAKYHSFSTIDVFMDLNVNNDIRSVVAYVQLDLCHRSMSIASECLDTLIPSHNTRHSRVYDRYVSLVSSHHSQGAFTVRALSHVAII